MEPTVYILASGKRGTLYVGVTSDLIQRVWQHREGMIDGFTRQYKAKQLVYFEQHDSMIAAITREKQIKKWRRQWKRSRSCYWYKADEIFG